MLYGRRGVNLLLNENIRTPTHAQGPNLRRRHRSSELRVLGYIRVRKLLFYAYNYNNIVRQTARCCYKMIITPHTFFVHAHDITIIVINFPC